MNPRPIPPSDLPLRVLFLAANPSDSERLRLDKEVRQIQRKIRSSLHHASVDVHFQLAVEADDFQQTILEVRPHVVHFSGHGTKGNELVVEPSGGRRVSSMGSGPLADLFRILRGRSPVRLVVLNACYSVPIAEALAKHVDCAIGMNEAIEDTAAVEFASSFYRAIAFGCSVQEAFELGVNALHFRGGQDASVPELFPRDQPDRSSLVLIELPGARANTDQALVERKQPGPPEDSARSTATARRDDSAPPARQEEPSTPARRRGSGRASRVAVGLAVLAALAGAVAGTYLLLENPAVSSPPAPPVEALEPSKDANDDADTKTALPSAALDSAAPDSATPLDSAAPDSAAPDSAAPDSAAPDSAAPDSGDADGDACRPKDAYCITNNECCRKANLSCQGNRCKHCSPVDRFCSSEDPCCPGLECKEYECKRPK